jgi:hypothetical protein
MELLSCTLYINVVVSLCFYIYSSLHTSLYTANLKVSVHCDTVNETDIFLRLIHVSLIQFKKLLDSRILHYFTKFTVKHTV